MKNVTKLALLAILLLALAACQPAVAPTPVPAEPPLPSEPAAPTEAAPEAPEESAPASSALAGTSWVLSSLDGGQPLPDTNVTLQFGADGSVSGSDGCNRVMSTYTESGDALTIAQPMASTMMACEEAVMNQAAAFQAALAKTTGFAVNAGELSLLAGDQVVATFAADVQSLAGTDWDVTMYNNGREAVVGLVEGTEITASFGENGELAGSAGCNQYIGGYTTDGNTIQISQIGTTFRFCPEPEGIMEQEGQFLAALQSAATFRIEGDTLELRTAADQMAVLMSRKAIVDLPAPEPAPAVPTGRVTGAQVLNIRSGPGTNFPVIGAARNGDEGEIVGRSADGRWWVVAVPTAPDGIGWVSADFVLATNVENVPIVASPPPPAPTPTRVPPPPTPTRVPAAATATPVPAQPTATPSAEVAFWADRNTINAGQCATLNWSVQNVQAVWVYPRGQHYAGFPRTGQGSEVVCPTTTTTYEMRVRMRDGSTIIREQTITVNAPAPTATPAPAPNPLAGTRWEVVNYNDGSAIVTLIPNTRVTADFSADGQVNGNAGCNTYFASYQVSGNNISIGQPGSTSRFCVEPEGIMDQEARFLAALRSAATFRIDGNMLELTNAGGQIVVVANRAP